MRLEALDIPLVNDPARMSVYEADGLTAKRQLPGVVVLPETVEQVVEKFLGDFGIRSCRAECRLQEGVQ